MVKVQSVRLDILCRIARYWFVKNLIIKYWKIRKKIVENLTKFCFLCIMTLSVLLFYVKLMKNIEEDAKFQKMKQTVQSILDKHLPSDKQFSVRDYNKEQIWYLCRLLLEKDDEKRKVIWNEIQDKLKYAKYEYEKQFSEILKHKEEFDNCVSNLKTMDDLVNDVEAENEIDENLKRI